MFARTLIRYSSRCAPSAAVRVPAAAPRMLSPARSTVPMMPVRAFASDVFLDPKEVSERIMGVVTNFEKVKDASKVAPDSKFKEDLDLDSLDAVEVVLAIEEEFGIEIPDSEADRILSISDAVDFIKNHPQAK